MLVCPQCHTENGDAARLCVSCGAALPGLPSSTAAPRLEQDSDTFDALYAPTLMMAATHGSPSAPGDLPHPEPAAGPAATRSGPSLIVIGAGALLALSVFGWWAFSSPGTPTLPPPALPASAVAPAASATPTPPPASAAVSPVVAPQVDAPASTAATAVPVPGAAAAAVRAKKRAAEIESARLAREAEQERERQTQREREETERRSAEEQQAQAALASAMVPPPPPPAPTAKETCADRNLLLRGFCESRECGKPEHAGEAYCKTLKEHESRRPIH